jgi:heme-degrading monooxygenase HmoA
VAQVWAQAVSCQCPGYRRNNPLTGVAADTGAEGQWPWRSRKEATVEEHFVWMTTRQIEPGTLTDFERAWRPDAHPEGMLRAYAYWSADGREIIGVSFWASEESCQAWRSSGAEARRREAMAGYVVGEQERFYRGRELHVPDH